VDLEQFLQTVATRAPDLRSEEEILRAAGAALGQLAAYVSGAAAERLAAELPAPLGSALTPATAIPEGGESHEFYAGVAAREGTEPAAASARAQAVLRAIAETVPVDTVARSVTS